jgi:hypothetical protein
MIAATRRPVEMGQALGCRLSMATSTGKPSEGFLHKSLRLARNTDAMSDDQPVKVPRKHSFERSPCEFSVREGKPDVARDAAMWIGDATKLEQSIFKHFPGNCSMVLDEIRDYQCSRPLVKEEDLFDWQVAFEHKLIQIVHPIGWRLVPQDACERQALELFPYLPRAPQRPVGKELMPCFQSPDVELRRDTRYFTFPKP